jgi:hypothetical protein
MPENKKYEGHQFSYSDRNAFLITIVSEEIEEH